MEASPDISTHKAIAKEKIRKLVEEFSKYSREEIDGKPEEQIKWHFIEPLLVALGWEKKDIDKESRVQRGRADYVLKSGNQDLLVVEAKKTGVSLSEEEGRQAVSYAYHRKIKFAVLTNFKQIRVYHALSNIKNINNNLVRDGNGNLYIDCKDFENEFDRLWLLSKESLENGELLKCLPKKEERVSKPIDESILEDLLQYRAWLSKDLKSHRAHLSDEQIDEIVQILIDRLIFIRSVEDRGLEDKDILLKVVTDYRQGRNSRRVWDTLLSIFREFDRNYNSKLFSEGLLEKDGFFSEEGSLLKVITGLYYGTIGNRDRYMFDVIPGDLLGNIYEQYLGTILKGSDKRVKLEGGTGKRKSMGIYYTPAYIVDYIVKNTVGEYIRGKTIDEILEVKILDPACGSGSFLIRAFQEVCDAIERKLKEGESSTKKISGFKEYKGRLNLGQKIQILTNCIFGVDLDEKAVELVQLNLLLKLLEDEEPAIKKHILPNMRDNIKCGNSLIDDPEVAGDKAFNWHAQFPDIFGNGGFDVVIGNPPYIRIQTLNKREIDFFTSKFKAAGKGNYDIYVLFVEKGLDILNPHGKFGYILPHKFFNAQYGESLRNLIASGKHLSKIIHFGDQQVFEGATTYTCLLFLAKGGCKDFNFIKVTNLEDWKNSGIAEEGEISAEQVTGKEWNLSIVNGIKAFERMREMPVKLGDVARIFQGLVTGADKVFVIDSPMIIEKDILRPFLKSQSIQAYGYPQISSNMLFPYYLKEGKATLIPEKDFESKYPNAWKYLKSNEKILKEREGGKWNHNQWYAFGRSQNLIQMDDPKLIIQVLSLGPRWIYDDRGLYMTGGGGGPFYGLRPKDGKTNIFFLMGVLNSKLFGYVVANQSTKMRGGYIRFSKQYIETFPIYMIDFSNKTDKSIYDAMVRLVNSILALQKRFHDPKMSGNEKERLEQQICNIDYEIDQEVYKLYGITKEEQKIIEESLKK